MIDAKPLPQMIRIQPWLFSCAKMYPDLLLNHYNYSSYIQQHVWSYWCSWLMFIKFSYTLYTYITFFLLVKSLLIKYFTKFHCHNGYFPTYNMTIYKYVNEICSFLNKNGKTYCPILKSNSISYIYQHVHILYYYSTTFY